MDITTGSDTASGISWGECFATLTKALTAAEPGDDVWMAQGTYTPGATRADTFAVPSGVRLYGGFTHGMTTPTQRDAEACSTVLKRPNRDTGER